MQPVVELIRSGPKLSQARNKNCHKLTPLSSLAIVGRDNRTKDGYCGARGGANDVRRAIRQLKWHKRHQQVTSAGTPGRVGSGPLLWPAHLFQTVRTHKGPTPIEARNNESKAWSSQLFPPCPAVLS